MPRVAISVGTLTRSHRTAECVPSCGRAESRVQPCRFLARSAPDSGHFEARPSFPGAFSAHLNRGPIRERGRPHRQRIPWRDSRPVEPCPAPANDGRPARRKRGGRRPRVEGRRAPAAVRRGRRRRAARDRCAGGTRPGDAGDADAGTPGAPAQGTGGRGRRGQRRPKRGGPAPAQVLAIQ
jgi:hypothetical protein